MMPPRLVVGEVSLLHPGTATISTDNHLATLLERAGHTVHAIDPDDDPGAIQQVDLVLLDAPADPSGDAIAHAAELLAPYARPQQLVLHTNLLYGPQALDELETAHAIAMCAHNLFGNAWVTSAADELGETLVSILITEVGGTAIPINDADRPTIAAAQRLRALESVARLDAFDLLQRTIPAMEVLGPDFLAAPSAAAASTTPPQLNPPQLDRLAAAIDDPGARRLFVDLERRRAEQLHETDTELWAYEHYEGKRQ